MATEFKLSYTASDINERLGRIDNLAKKSDIPSKLSELTNDSGFTTESYVNSAIANIDIPEVDLKDYALKSEIPTDYLKSIPSEYVTESELNAKSYLTSFTETDPTVPAWAKAATKPTYTAGEVGALPADTVIPTVPTNVSAFTNDVGYLTKHQSLAGYATETYANTAVSSHNTNNSAHNDIRLLIEGLTNRLNTLADSDDTTLDQMSEIVAYIKSNKSLIEDVTTNKVNVADIINNLTTNVSNKPLSAAQGVALKALIDAITVPTKVSELTNDSGYLSSVPSEYVTETELIAKGYLTEHQSLTGYATESYVNEGLATKQPIGDYVLKSDISDVSSAIIDVTELPTENIQENAFYRLLNGTFIYNQYTQNDQICYVVESLPEIGEPATVDMEIITAYYDISTNDVYCYINDVLAGYFSVPIGWYTLASLAPVLGKSWGGVITDILDDPRDNTNRLLLEYAVYSYKDGWTSHKTIGWAGTGQSAEIFNHLTNKATGLCSHAEGNYSHAEGDSSHAEGYLSHAEGYASHAEGRDTTASGSNSHAEGLDTTASGSNSHAEGNNTRAVSDNSHAEGFDTTASNHNAHAEGLDTTAAGYASHAEGRHTTAAGDYSHAEGFTIAAMGRSQHAQGEYNILDPEYDINDSGKRGKYAHIVGNGTNEISRSNAHTLDWSGNGWFAGDVFVGGSGQDDEAAVKLATINDVSSKQDVITGTAGQFVVIGTNGKPTTKTILIAEEATF